MENNNEKRENTQNNRNDGQNRNGNYRHNNHHRRKNGKHFGNKPKAMNENQKAAETEEAVAGAPVQEATEAAKNENREPVKRQNKNHERQNQHQKKKQPQPAAEEQFGSGFVPEPEPERKYMFDYDPQQYPERQEEAKTIEVVGIKFRNGSKIYYFSPLDIKFEKGEHAIVETVRGVEYGEIALGNKLVGESEVVFPLKPVLRKATKEDDERNAENRKLEENARPIWNEKVAKNGLDMQLVDVEYTHDNAKLCFYFTADGRVDFRELVKDLAGVFRTRIELRQIGVRDEAKLYGGLGSCGRPFCCKTFLPDFAQVSIKMAKEQNLSLSSSKISGSCGRLMCCLRFEHDTYEREYATFPKVDTIVDTPKGRGVIVESSFLTGKIKVKMNNDQSIKVFGKAELKPLGMIKVKDDVSEDLKQLEDK